MVGDGAAGVAQEQVLVPFPRAERGAEGQQREEGDAEFPYHCPAWLPFPAAGALSRDPALKGGAPPAAVPFNSARR